MLRTVVAALTLSLLAGSAAAQNVFTPTNRPTCKDYSKPEFGHWVCPGPGGYAVAFMDEGNIAGLKIAPASAIRNGAATEQWLGSGQVFGDRVQWVLRDGAPKAAVIRIWRRKSVEDSTELQELQVYAIDGAKACPVATVEARMAKGPRFEQRFTAKRMAEEYLHHYRALAGSQPKLISQSLVPEAPLPE